MADSVTTTPEHGGLLDDELAGLGLAPGTLPERDFALDVPALDAAIQAHAPRVVYVCSPQNPAGACTPLAVFEELARHRILVRDASTFGLPRHVRVAARGAEERGRLLAALREELPS